MKCYVTAGSTTVSVAIMATLFLSVLAVIGSADTGLIPDYTPAESKYMPGLRAMALKDETRALAECNTILRTTPEASACQLLRAEIYLRRGQLVDAEKDLQAVISRQTSDAAYALDRLAVLYAYKNDKDAEGKTYRRLVQVYRAAKAEDGQPRVWADIAAQYLARALEAEGRVEEAIASLRTIGEPTPTERDRTLREWYVAQVNVRAERYKDAVGIYRAIGEGAKKTILSPELLSMQMDQVDALWAAGDRRSAMLGAIDVLDKALTASDGAETVIARAAGTVHILTINGDTFGTDMERTRRLLKASSKRLESRGHSVVGAVRSLLVSGPEEDTIRQTDTALRGAPRTEWALWSALYLGLAQPDQAGNLLKLVPAGSVQRTIAEVEAKAKTETLPAHGKGDIE